jgi:hypothetical protein
MTNKNKYLTLIVLVCLVLLSVTGCAALRKMLQNPNYIYENGAVLVDGGDQPVRLINNPASVDVTFKDVVAFIRLDTTDLLEYIDRGNPAGIRPFVCSDFAEAVHNNAELAGIRAGYVSIDWVGGSIGHAVDAFQTTDLGLVYFDCTGKSIFSQIEENNNKITMGSWDKVGYLEIGKTYGVVGLPYAESPDYIFFEQYDKKWAEFKRLLSAYNADVKLYNQEIEGKVFRQGTPEYLRIQVWEKDLVSQENVLDKLTLEIGDSRFKPLGVVSNFEIHW